jgi:hypothetical protein
MILVYNENENPQWELVKKNNFFIRINNKNCNFGLDLLSKEISESEIDTEALANNNELRAPKVVLNKNTIIRYDKIKLQPYIRTSQSDFNTDIILASFDISAGERLINHSAYGVYISQFEYDYEKHQLHVIISIDSTVENPYLEFYFMNKSENVAALHCLIYDSKTKEFKAIYRSKAINAIPPKGSRGYINTNDRSIDKTKYNIRCYIPSRPTNNIVINDPDEKNFICNTLIEKFKLNPEKTNFILSKEDLKASLKDLVRYHGFVGITYYDGSKTAEEVKESRDTYLDKLNEEKFAKYFNVVFVMTNDGRVTRLK